MSGARIPAPLKDGHLCPACKGTGADIEKTRKHRGDGYIMCVPCNGNGLDPAEYFRWSDKGKPA
jgi:hypothetical protein